MVAGLMYRFAFFLPGTILGDNTRYDADDRRPDHASA
jgi:hypothetical protein